MKINSLERIWNNLGYVLHGIGEYKKHSIDDKRLVYNVSPVRLKSGVIKNTFIEVGYLYLLSRVKDDSQGFIRFDCVDRINYDKAHKIYTDKLPEVISDNILARHNDDIAQIYNDKTKEYLHKDSNITWKTLTGQELFTTLDEAKDYIYQCENGMIPIKDFNASVLVK